ncbi:MAG: tRNA (adenosine(37)-N6)-threonylcarbamoyltransferase complex ATPase subunit type 1 TsaE [Pseudomonadota bacterium]
MKSRILANEMETQRVGRQLATLLQGGDWLCLSGPLGVGKSVLARAIIRARLGATTEVPSPSYTLVNVYEAETPVWHADLYRLGGPDETDELGLCDDNADRVVLCEWPERMGRLLPGRRCDIALAFREGEARDFAMTLVGPGWSTEWGRV